MHFKWREAAQVQYWEDCSRLSSEHTEFDLSAGDASAQTMLQSATDAMCRRKRPIAAMAGTPSISSRYLRITTETID